MTSEPGEDTCLECSHPDHGKAECGALMGVFYGDDGSADDDLCDCRAARVCNDSGEDEEVVPWPY